MYTHTTTQTPLNKLLFSSLLIPIPISIPISISFAAHTLLLNFATSCGLSPMRLRMNLVVSLNVRPESTVFSNVCFEGRDESCVTTSCSVDANSVDALFAGTYVGESGDPSVLAYSTVLGPYVPLMLNSCRDGSSSGPGYVLATISATSTNAMGSSSCVKTDEKLRFEWSTRFTSIAYSCCFFSLSPVFSRL